jgi:predicted amidohydrolase YtcJ
MGNHSEDGEARRRKISVIFEVEVRNFADLVLENANIITCDKAMSRAQALALKDDQIAQVGSNQEINSLKTKNTKVIDCEGMTLVPGFNDAHCHIFPLINRMFSLDLSPSRVKSIEDIQKEIHRKARFSPPGRWISGSAYNEFYLTEKRHPTRFDLDDPAPNNPVILLHRSSHACVLNSLALKMVGINNETEEPAGGLIERDLESGEPNGILFEMSGYLSEKINSPVSGVEMDWAINQANEIYLSNGITSIGEAGVKNDFAQWQTFLKLKQEGKLKSRIYMMFGAAALANFQKADLKTGGGDFNLRLGSLKIILSEARGVLQPAQTELNRTVLEASRDGYKVAIHAVEKTTVEAAIEALEGAQMLISGRLPRPRLEHCSECPPELIKRLHKLGAVAVSQPPFLYYSGERYLSQVSPEARQWLYPFKSLLNGGVKVAASSDSPVASNNPLVGIYSAVTRLAESGQAVLPTEGLSPEQALEMYTSNGAFASSEENIKGTLSPGKLADVVMLSSDPLKSSADELKEIKVERTIIGGEVVWERDKEKTGEYVRNA